MYFRAYGQKILSKVFTIAADVRHWRDAQVVMERKNAKFGLDELNYYFDCQEKDAMDSGKLARKVGQVLNIRSKLLSLPPEEFEHTIAAIEKLITNVPEDNASQKREARSQKQREAMELFEKASNTKQSAGRATQISKV